MNANTIWALVAGLAVGLLVGRELPRGRGGSSEGGAEVAAKAADKAPAAGIPKELPADLAKLIDEMKATDKFAGMTVAQKYVALKALNDTPCDCGCPHGSSAKCIAEDPNCPVAPKKLTQAIDLAKAGKSLDDVLAAIKKKDGGGGSAGKPAEGAPQKVDIAAWTPVKGPKNAKVTIVAFSDFQCPFCSRVVPTMHEIEEKYGKDVRIAFRHQPLPFHDKAVGAAEAAMAAHSQGKFFEMHDKLFGGQRELSDEIYVKWAGELGLNVARFKSELESHKHKANIEADSKAGTGFGASGTPSFFINGRPLVGAQPFDAFKAVIEEEIKHADELLKAGTPADKLYDKLLETAKAAAPAPAAAAPAAAEHVDIEVGSAPVKGPKNAPVTLICFSDFQCPFCSRVVPTMKQLEKDYEGKIRIAFKHRPLPFHDKAHLAAEASLAAHAQGKFWEMHDALFANQQELDRAGLEKRATEIGLNVDKFKKALDAGEFKAAVDKDNAEAEKVGAGGTPTFFVNGNKLVGAQPVDAFKKAIDAELARKK